MKRHRQLQYLLEEGVGVARPNEVEGNCNCPPGWYGVWDDKGGYIAYFQHKEDAYSFRLLLCAMRQNGRQITRRYKKRKK